MRKTKGAGVGSPKVSTQSASFQCDSIYDISLNWPICADVDTV